jgi:hypothetical protein
VWAGDFDDTRMHGDTVTGLPQARRNAPRVSLVAGLPHHVIESEPDPAAAFRIEVGVWHVRRDSLRHAYYGRMVSSPGRTTPMR